MATSAANTQKSVMSTGEPVQKTSDVSVITHSTPGADKDTFLYADLETVEDDLKVCSAISVVLLNPVFDTNPMLFVQCAVCLSPMIDPVIHTCGKMLCSSCLNNCPTCPFCDQYTFGT